VSTIAVEQTKQVGRQQVGEMQRARILAAIVQLVRERGVANVTVAHTVARSRVSRRTFYELFEDREACLLAAFQDAVQKAGRLVLPRYHAAGPEWSAGMRAGLTALLEFIDRNPAAGSLCVVDAPAAGPLVRERRSATLAVLVDAVHAGRGEAVGRKPRRLVAEGVVGAVLLVLHERLLVREPKPLIGLVNQLMAMIVLPYLGPAAAAREQSQAAPRPGSPGPPGGDSNPLPALEMRLTYRTMRVLQAIAEHPQTSSRTVSAAAGIADQGQMSKLLWRLEGRGLIANGAPVRPGEPRAWSLTARGREVERAIAAQADG
jgi:AcrR family transcriptional regulator